MFRLDAARKSKNHALSRFIDIALQPQERLDAASPVRERGRRAPEIDRTGFTCLLQFSRSRRRGNQNNRGEAIEGILFQTSAKLKTTDVRKMIVEQDQIGLQLTAESAGRFRVFRRENVVSLVFEERFPIFSFRRYHVHKQNRRVHEPLPLTHFFGLAGGRISREIPARYTGLRASELLGTWRFEVLGLG